MARKVTINILRTFVDEKGRHGNPTGIIEDEKQELTKDERQKIATTMQLVNILGRKIEIHQGAGSVIFADTAGQNMARVGGGE